MVQIVSKNNFIETIYKIYFKKEKKFILETIKRLIKYIINFLPIWQIKFYMI